ncbi:MAG: class I tRNA ligase family protein [Chthoniobacterales bacterium]
MKPYFITTAIDYTNAAPHIGHAYEKILADVLARYQRLRGREVFFLTGVDQHGQKVQQAAEKQGISPQKFTDALSQQFLDLWKELSISYDAWAATTDPKHTVVVQQILTHLLDKGWLYKASYQGYYSVRQEQFLTDKERNEAGEFGAEWGEVVFLEEENWYFRLSQCREWLASFLEAHPNFITPAFRQTELKNAAAKISGDLCISRPKSRLSWGIEIPFDPDFVVYVWFDALINYISFAGYLNCGDTTTEKRKIANANAVQGATVHSRGAHKEVLDDAIPTSSGMTFGATQHCISISDFSQLWPCDAHVIGKDILIPAHGIYWPCMLHAMGFPDEQMPHLLVHGFWTLNGEKISKSTGNVFDLVKAVDRFGASALRYYLMRDAVMGRDADFNEERLLARYHAELSNGLGNLLNRTLGMIARYRPDGLLPVTLPEEFSKFLADHITLIHLYCQQMESSQIHAGLETMVEIVTRTNVFIDVTAPWKLAKDPTQENRLSTILITLLQSTRIAATLLLPVAPTAAAEIFKQLALEPLILSDTISIPELPEKYHAGKATPVFPRFLEEKEKEN